MSGFWMVTVHEIRCITKQQKKNLSGYSHLQIFLVLKIKSKHSTLLVLLKLVKWFAYYLNVFRTKKVFLYLFKMVYSSFFLERNMLSFFLKIMNQKCGSYVCVQLLQTLNILFENIRNETSICESNFWLLQKVKLKFFK